MEHGLRISGPTVGRVPVYFGIGAINASATAAWPNGRGKRYGGGRNAAPLSPTHDERLLHFKTIAGSIPDTPVLLC